MEKNGRWFLELILNILLLMTVVFVTFAAKGEQTRGGFLPFMSLNNVHSPLPSTPNRLSGSQEEQPITQSFSQAWGSLQVWASGLDGKVTQDELKSILNNIQGNWKNPPTVHEYLKNINHRINAGQMDQVIKEALQSLAAQTNEQKALVLRSVKRLMEDNGVTLEKIQQLVSRWGTEAFKLNQIDLKKMLGL